MASTPHATIPDRTVRDLAVKARKTLCGLARASSSSKDAFLRHAAAMLHNRRRTVLESNARDLEAARASGISGAMLERLELDDRRIDGLIEGLQQVATLPDPVGAIEGLRRLPNGLQVGRMRVPLGLIGMVYESRPNVTVDAAALCIKSGNAILLRGGSESIQTNRALAALLRDALEAVGLEADAIAFVDSTDRACIDAMMELSGTLDLLIPRGGPALINRVATGARVPVLQHYKGVCHLYIDSAADLAKATAIALNAKLQRPGVCNAMETLLIDEAIAHAYVPAICDQFAQRGVELRGDARVCALYPQALHAKDEDWDSEYLDAILNVGVVDGIEGALDHIGKHGSLHTESIVTDNYDNAMRWLREIDASMALVNASTRFNDGFEIGLGAEIGISTSKLHAFGPMGLEELCARKWVALGTGQVRL